MKSLPVLLVLLFVFAPAMAADQCDPADPAMQACINQTLIDRNVIIAGRVVDPGGTKMKEATDSCLSDCALLSADFNRKYRKP